MEPLAIDVVPKDLIDHINRLSMELEWSRRLPIYEIHKWWARRYSGFTRVFLILAGMSSSELNVKTYDDLKELYKFGKVKNKVLLDPFSGGGTIVFEGNKVGYKAYGMEINKVAYSAMSALKNLDLVLEMRDNIIKQKR